MPAAQVVTGTGSTIGVSRRPGHARRADPGDPSVSATIAEPGYPERIVATLQEEARGR